MRRRNELLVGAAILVAVGAVIAGALFLGEADIGRGTRLQTARFRSIGRLQPGAPVLLRGVRVGTVQAVRLAKDNWVEADLRVDRRATYPEDPTVLIISASLFGEWQAQIVSRARLPDNPIVRANINEAAQDAGRRWPGTDLPGIGELTLQANRIANDVGLITSRMEGALDSSVIADLRATVADLRDMAGRLQRFSKDEASTWGRITHRTDVITENLSGASGSLRNSLGRVDTATQRGELADIIGNTREASRNFKDVSADVKDLTAALQRNRETLIRVLQGLDTLMTRIQKGQGTLARLTTDSTLYTETAATLAELRALVADIRVNPRKYFRFSVF